MKNLETNGKNLHKAAALIKAACEIYDLDIICVLSNQSETVTSVASFHKGNLQNQISTLQCAMTQDVYIDLLIRRSVPIDAYVKQKTCSKSGVLETLLTIMKTKS